MNPQQFRTSAPKEFPALNRLNRLYFWMAIVGAVLLAIGFGLVAIWQAWFFAIPPLSGGVIGLAGGLWGRYRVLRLIDRLRTRRLA
jgi:hypothetical protein